MKCNQNGFSDLRLSATNLDDDREELQLLESLHVVRVVCRTLPDGPRNSCHQFLQNFIEKNFFFNFCNLLFIIFHGFFSFLLKYSCCHFYQTVSEWNEKWADKTNIISFKIKIKRGRHLPCSTDSQVLEGVRREVRVLRASGPDRDSPPLPPTDRWHWHTTSSAWDFSYSAIDHNHSILSLWHYGVTWQIQWVSRIYISGSKTSISESTLTTFEPSSIFWGSSGSSKNWLKLKIKPP